MTTNGGTVTTNITSTPVLSVDVVTNATDGSIYQVKAPQGLLNLDSLSSTKYQLQMFYNSDVTPPSSSGQPYGTNGTAFDVWTIDGSAGTNTLTVTESPQGAASRSFTYTYTNMSGNSGWLMTDSSNLRTILSWQAPSAGNTNEYSIYRQILSGNMIVQMSQTTLTNLGGIFNITRQIDGTGSVTNITAYSYNSSNLVQEIDYPNGNWVYRTYDDQQRIVAEYSPYGNTASPASTGAPPDPSTCKTVIYDYEQVASDDNTNVQVYLARTEVTYLPGSNQVSVVYRSCPAGEEVEEWRYPESSPGSWPGSGGLLTTTVNYVNPDDVSTFGQIAWQVMPDGTAKLYSYLEDTNGNVTNIIVQTGQPDNTINPSKILNGTQTSSLFNSWGQIASVTNRYIAAGSVSTVLSGEKYTYNDALQLSYTMVDLANRTNQYEYACCGLASSVDPDGVSTLYTYDTLKRLVATTILRGGTSGVTLTNVLDAAGRVLINQRIGTDGSVMTLGQSQYDVLGHPVSQTNALMGVTTQTNVLSGNQLCVTNIYPDGGTRVEVYYADGRLQSLSGTAVKPVQYEYGAIQDSDGSWREFTLQINTSASGGTNEWTKTYTDGAGRLYKTIYNGASSIPYSISYYNSFGQLTNTVDPDGVSTLYGYDSEGRQDLTVADVNQNGQIDYSGQDRVTYTTNDVTTDYSTSVQRIRTYAWSATGSPASNLISTVETSTDGLRSWDTIWNNGTAVTTRSTTVFASNGNRYVTNSAADNSFTVDAYQYGQLVSETRYDANTNQLGKVSYGYDPHWRQNTATDARNGTTTYYFNAADQISSTVTPSPGSGQSAEVTTNYFDNMGRVVATTLPDYTGVTNRYYPTGQLQLTYGSRTYPVGYSYDSQGRMNKMTNWTSFTTQSGPEVTTWNYDLYRGFLTNKTYAGNTAGPKYSYTSAGRLETRLWARGTNTTYSYNAAGDLASVAYNDGFTPTVSYGYDRRGRLTAVTNGTAICTRTFNDNSQLLSESWSGGPLSGLLITNSYDQLLRRTNLAAFNGSSPLAAWAYTFDTASRLYSVSDGTSSATYSYLANSPLISQIGFTNSGAVRMTTTKQYDYLNRLLSVSSAPSGSPTVSFNYTYNSANQRTGATNADGSFWLYTYDNLGQVISGNKYWANGTPVAGEQFDYAFDSIGNRQTTYAGGDQYGMNLRSAVYSANNLNQYTSRTVPGAVDVIGTASASATVTVNDEATYRNGTFYHIALPLANSSGAVWQSVTNLVVLHNGATNDIITNSVGNLFLPQSPESFAYDADGNLTQDGRWTYTWDGENRLVQMQALSSLPTGAKLTLSFTYDWQGRRIEKLVSTNNGSAYFPLSTNLFAYDGWNLITELLAPSSLLRTYMWGLDLSGTAQGAGGVGGLLSVAYIGTQPTNAFCAFDGNGNVAALVSSANGATVAIYEYGPFEDLLRATGPMAKDNPFQFSTKYKDDETDLVYYGYRYYNASTGRWLSSDPLEELGFVILQTESEQAQHEFNLYEAFSNDSINSVDAYGLWCLKLRVDLITYHIVKGNIFNRLAILAFLRSHFPVIKQFGDCKNVCICYTKVVDLPYVPIIPLKNTLIIAHLRLMTTICL